MKELLVIYPSQGFNCIFTILVAKTGETLASHFCTHEGYAESDLYSGRPERVEKWNERFGEIEVKFLDQTDISYQELLKRNKEWSETLPKEKENNSK